MPLFEYAVIKEEKTDKDGEVVEPAVVVVPVTQILAENESQAQMVAARAIPEDHIGDLGRITVAMRPF